MTQPTFASANDAARGVPRWLLRDGRGSDARCVSTLLSATARARVLF